MALLPYDINAYIQADATIIALAGGTIKIFPLVGVEACNPTDSFYADPLIRYFWMPDIFSFRKYLVRRDRIRYYVMDRDVDRMWSIADRLIDIFDMEHRGRILIPSASNKNVIYWSGIITSKSIEPTERDGLAQMQMDFEFRYTKQ